MNCIEIPSKQRAAELVRPHERSANSHDGHWDFYGLTPVGDIIVDEDGLILEASLTAAEMLATTSSTLAWQAISFSILDEDIGAFNRLRNALIQSGEPQQCELRMVKSDGTIFPAGIVGRPSFEEGEPVLLISFHDITAQMAMDASLRTALEHAEAGGRAKAEFLAMMSHELRTPLNGVLGFSQLLGITTLSDEQRGYVGSIDSCGKHLLQIVNDILDLSSHEKGTLAIQAAPLAVAHVVTLSCETVRNAAADKGLDFRCETASGVPEQIVGDERRILQILINLLGNAVKFTAEGTVVLHIGPVSVDGRRFLEFSVRDSGIGISSGTLARLFQPFAQADSTTSRRFGGTGLGLAISKRLAEAMGGSITVTSTPGMGSTFTFHLPLGDSAAGSSVPPGSISVDPEPAAHTGNPLLGRG